MGYAVYITRARHHREGAQSPIPQRDWRAVIAADPDLGMEDQASIRARWAGPSTVEDPTIEWADGNLFSLDPDPSVIRKLIDIAGLLGGRVQGDTGELYVIERGRIVSDHPPEDETESPSSPAAPFRGVEPGPTPGLDGAMAEEELEAALGALTAQALAGAADAPKEPDDPNASFARPLEEALGQNPGAPAPGPVPFSVGQRVRTSWGRPGTIVSIDPDADWGMGSIEIKYDDGRTATTSCIAHGLEPE